MLLDSSTWALNLAGKGLRRVRRASGTQKGGLQLWGVSGGQKAGALGPALQILQDDRTDSTSVLEHIKDAFS